MGKKYVTRFASEDGRRYRVEVELPDGSGTVELTAGGTPFTTTMEGGDTIYEPVKGEGATLSAVTGDIPMELFSAHAMERPATLYWETGVGDNVQWAGYVEPCVYSQGWGKIETLEINLVNTLAALKEIPYSRVCERPGIARMVDVVLKILSLDERISTVYVSDAVRLERAEARSPMEGLEVNEENFFEERKDAGQSAADLAMSCHEVLAEICRWLGYTAVQRGTAVYLLDYDAIRNQGTAAYWRYGMRTGTWDSGISLTTTGHVGEGSYHDGDASFSLGEVYDKVTVKDDFRKFDSVISGMFDGAENITADDAMDGEAGNTQHFGVTVGDNFQLEGGVNKKMNVFFDSSAMGNFAGVAVKYFKPMEWVDRAIYMPTNEEWEAAGVKRECSYSRASWRGCYLMKAFSVAGPEDLDFQTFWDLAVKSKDADEFVDNFMEESGVSSISLSNYIMLVNPPSPNHIQRERAREYPFLRLRPGTINFGGENNFIVIKGSVAFQPMYSRLLADHYEDGPRFPIPDSSRLWDPWFDGMGHGNDALDEDAEFNASILCSLRIGERYWNGNGWEQDNRPGGHPCFYMKYFDMKHTKKEDRRGPKIVGRFHKILNTVNWRQGISEEGYCIPVPNTMSGDLELIIYAPIDNQWKSTGTGGFIGRRWDSDIMLLKDFDMKFVIGDPTLSGDLDSDTEYSNVIDERNAGSLGDIDFKVCTYDNKNPNFSSVSLADQRGYADKVFNAGLIDAQIRDGVTGWDGKPAQEGLRQEEHLVYRLCRQYSSPTRILECNLKRGLTVPWGLYTNTTMADARFVVDTIGTDYRAGFDSVKLIEKK